MPTGHCKFPEHHNSPSAKPVLGWLGALGLGALIITHLHTVELVLIVLGILAALAVPVFLLWHNHGSGYDPDLERQAAADRVQTLRSAAYTITPASSPAVVPAKRRAALEGAPVIHQHVHFHGLRDDEMAAVARKAIEPPRDGAW